MDPTDRAEGHAEGEPLELVVYLREAAGGAAAERQRAVVERARDLVGAGDVGDLTVRTWGRRALAPEAADGPAADAPGADVLDTVREFQAAAAEHGLTLEPCFAERERRPSFFTEREQPRREVVLPVVCLAVRRGGDLVGLYPCVDDGECASVAEGLAALAGDEPLNLES